MKIVQKIFSHGLLIAFFVAVFFVYLYRGELFPQWFDKQAQTEVTPSQSAAQQSAVVSAEEPPPAQASSTDDDEGQAAALVSTEQVVEAVEQPSVTQPLSVDGPAAAAAAAQTEAMNDVPAGGEQPAESAAQAADAATAAQYRPVGPEEASRQTYNPLVPRTDDADAAQYRPVEADEASREAYHPVAEVPASVITAPEYRPLAAEKAAPADATAASAKPAAVPADSGVASESDFQSQLEQARQHYWRRDMPAAEQAYRRLTESHPEQAEVWGELGNLYFSQREMVQATDAYYRAIELLIEQGDAERARQLLGAMYQLDAEKAKELETQLRQAGS
jgi:tetratricopeptide (TPR) repeat protein